MSNVVAKTQKHHRSWSWCSSGEKKRPSPRAPTKMNYYLGAWLQEKCRTFARMMLRTYLIFPTSSLVSMETGSIISNPNPNSHSNRMAQRKDTSSCESVNSGIVTFRGGAQKVTSKPQFLWRLALERGQSDHATQSRATDQPPTALGRRA